MMSETVGLLYEDSLRKVVEALFPAPEKREDGSEVDHSADGNLEAVICEMEASGADKVILGTLNTILIQLTAARAALGR